MIFHKGEVLFRQGESGPLFKILSGLFKVVRIQPDGNQFVFNLLVPGEIIPHHSLITPMEYHGTAIALIDSEVEVLPSADWYRGLQEHPERYREISVLLQEKLRMMQKRIDQLTAVSPADKFSLFQDWLQTFIPGIQIAEILTQEEIGQFVGLRRETINRLLRGKM